MCDKLIGVKSSRISSFNSLCCVTYVSGFYFFIFLKEENFCFNEDFILVEALGFFYDKILLTLCDVFFLVF